MLTGIPLNDMVLEWRMLHAKELLDNKSLSLRDVATRCGFRRNKNLIIAFRRRWGTPRRRIEQEDSDGNAIT